MSADMQSIKELHRGIIEGKTQEELDVLLWDAVLTYQDQTLHTLSGLEFSYTVKHKKNGEYSGELLVSRKETSKTLTRSSVLLAFHKILEATEVTRKVMKHPFSHRHTAARRQSDRFLGFLIFSVCFWNLV